MDENPRVEEGPVKDVSRRACGSATDPIGKATAGLMVIWLGIALLSRDRLDPWWAYMMSGFGVILILESFFRMARPEFRAPVGGKFVGGAVLVILGSLFISGFANWWAMILVVVGAVFLVQGIRGAMRR